jgi:beta-galactosidase GanA
MNVTYDSRSIVINGERALFLSGSMHPVRATKATWEAALDEAVRHGLNMVTIYVIWQIHQPFPDRDIDWSLPGQPECESPERDCEWNLAGSIRSAANRGLFVHIRVGPYVCAEYDYGGIPRWVALGDPEIAMRRPNKAWMERMRVFVTETVAYLTINNLWAYQGGPIVMAQIENELGGDVDASTEHLVKVNSEHRIVDGKLQNKGASELGNATLQDYADWCGSLAASLAPEVIWTMCNGLSAKNTISTFNGDSGVSWLENHGNSGRIQIDQPAIWTEDEG